MLYFRQLPYCLFIYCTILKVHLIWWLQLLTLWKIVNRLSKFFCFIPNNWLHFTINQPLWRSLRFTNFLEMNDSLESTSRKYIQIKQLRLAERVPLPMQQFFLFLSCKRYDVKPFLELTLFFLVSTKWSSTP